MFVQLVLTYDDNGRLMERREIGVGFEYVYTYQYDDQNRIASEMYDGEITEIYEYNADGSYKIQNANIEDEYTIYRADGEFIEMHFGNSKVVNVYDDAGKVLECVTYFNGAMTSKTVYSYDDNGNLVKLTYVDDYGNETVTNEVEYKLYTVKVK